MINQRFDFSLAGKPIASAVAFAEFVKGVERISFRTGTQRDGPTLKTPTETTPDRTSPNPDLPDSLAVFHVDDLSITPNDDPATARTAPSAKVK